MVHLLGKKTLIVLLSSLLISCSTYPFNWNALKSLHSIGAFLVRPSTISKLVGTCALFGATIAGVWGCVSYYKKMKLIRSLRFEDPNLFLQAAEKRIRELETELKDSDKNKEVLKYVDDVDQRLNEVLSINKEVVSIWLRRNDHQLLTDYLKANLYDDDNVLLSELKQLGPRVFDFLRLSKNATYNEFVAAISEKEHLGSSADISKCRLVRAAVNASRFGWENYKAWVFGASAVARLPQSEENVCSDLHERSDALRIAYVQMR